MTNQDVLSQADRERLVRIATCLTTTDGEYLDRYNPSEDAAFLRRIAESAEQGEGIDVPCKRCNDSTYVTTEEDSEGKAEVLPCSACSPDPKDTAPEEDGVACGWCKGEGAIRDPSGKLGAECPRCKGRTWLLQPGDPLLDPEDTADPGQVALVGHRGRYLPRERHRHLGG